MYAVMFETEAHTNENLSAEAIEPTQGVLCPSFPPTLAAFIFRKLEDSGVKQSPGVGRSSFMFRTIYTLVTQEPSPFTHPTAPIVFTRSPL